MSPYYLIYKLGSFYFPRITAVRIQASTCNEPHKAWPLVRDKQRVLFHGLTIFVFTILSPTSIAVFNTVFYFLADFLSPSLNREPLGRKGYHLLASVSLDFCTECGTEEPVNVHCLYYQFLKKKGGRSCHICFLLGYIRERKCSFSILIFLGYKKGLHLLVLHYG